MAHDYIPGNDDELPAFAVNFFDYTPVTKGGVSDQGGDSRPETPKPPRKRRPNHGKIGAPNKNETKKTLDTALRTYIQGFIARNPLLTDEDRERMGLPLRDAISTPHPAPGVKPAAEAVPSGKGRRTVTALNPLSGSKQKPPAVKGAAFARRMRGAEERPAIITKLLAAYAENIHFDGGKRPRAWKHAKETTMKKRHGVFVLVLWLLSLGVPLVAQEEGTGGKLSVTLDFSASVLGVTSTEDSTSVDSFTDAGFGDDNESTLSVSYEGDIFGAVASLAFVPATLHFLSGEIAEMFAGSPLSIDELYGWVKPFGPVLKFTAGIFENTDGIGDYTDDIDEYGIGVFFLGEEGEPFAEPDPTYTGPALTNGFLADFVVSPVTLQLLFASNYSGDSGSELASNLLGQMYQGTGAATPTIDTKERFFRLGGRVIFDAGVGTFSAVFKTHQWPMVIVNAVEGDLFPGKKLNYLELIPKYSRFA